MDTETKRVIPEVEKRRERRERLTPGSKNMTITSGLAPAVKGRAESEDP